VCRRRARSPIARRRTPGVPDPFEVHVPGVTVTLATIRITDTVPLPSPSPRRDRRPPACRTTPLWLSTSATSVSLDRQRIGASGSVVPGRARHRAVPPRPPDEQRVRLGATPDDATGSGAGGLITSPPIRAIVATTAALTTTVRAPGRSYPVREHRVSSSSGATEAKVRVHGGG
jgi:hypothetical protein